MAEYPLDGLAKALGDHRWRDFHRELEKLLEGDLKWLGGNAAKAKEFLSPSGQRKLGAFHYTSPSLGKWFRVLLSAKRLDKVLDLRPLELSHHELVYDEVPRSLNIPLLQNEKSYRWIVLGGEKGKGTSGLNAEVRLTNKEREDLRQLFEDFEIKDFYDLVTGLKGIEGMKGSSVKKSMKSLKTALLTLDLPQDIGATDARWRAFVFSFFLTIRLKEPAPIHLIVVPLREPGCEGWKSSSHPSWPAPAYVVAQTQRPTQALLDSIQEALLPVVRILNQLELGALEATRTQSVVVLENFVRTCTLLEERVQREVNLYGKLFIEKELGSFSAKHLRDDEPTKGILAMTGADPLMLRTLDRIKYAASEGAKTVLLYSEPGCGKENLAALCHWLSPRCMQADAVDQRVRAAWVKLHKQRRNELAGYIGPTKVAMLPKRPSGKPYHSPNWVAFAKRWPLFGYVTLNAGLVTNNNSQDLMFGSSDEYGAFATADAVRGTLFLDEFNTLPRGLENGLLRVLASPYQIVLRAGKHGANRTKDIDVQVIFGSNRSPDALIADGFNPAVISRVAEHAYRIPPLRERKVDIAVFVNYHLLKKKGDAKGALSQLHRISLDGLRVICELPWPDNYRGVRGLLDDILEERSMYHINESEIGFEEIVQAIARREAMGRATHGESPSRRHAKLD